MLALAFMGNVLINVQVLKTSAGGREPVPPSGTWV